MQQAVSSYTTQTIRYGTYESQEGDLYLPNIPLAPVVCLLHGGFWRMPYGREELIAVAEDIASRGYVVWNIEYRRLGVSDMLWTSTFEDVASALNYCATLKNEYALLDLERLIIVGHSAGGHLALWAAAQHQRPKALAAIRVCPCAAVGLSPVADLKAAADISVGNGAVLQLLGGSPIQYPERYAAASPMELLPLGIKQLIIHGTMDEVLPINFSANYVAEARLYKDNIQFIELPQAGHMDFLNPQSDAHTQLCQWLAQVTSKNIEL